MLNNLFQKHIKISSNINIYFKNSNFIVVGPLGSLNITVPYVLKVTINGALLTLSSFTKSMLLTFYALFVRTIYGVEFGFFSLLIIKGVGWHISLDNCMLIFKIGYSHVIRYPVPSNLEVFISDKQVLRIFGLNLGLVQQFSSKLCKLSKFNVYKGKGIYKFDKIVQLKLSSKSK